MRRMGSWFRAFRAPVRGDPLPAAGVLGPLAARYAWWLGLPAPAVALDEDSGSVRAMQIVLRVERSSPPPRTALLEAAASAAVAVCLDPRSAEGGPWHADVAAWVDGPIRKVSRRARATHWQAVQDLPGLTVAKGAATEGGPEAGAVSEVQAGAAGRAEVRALVPTLVSALPREVSRLQVAGTDLPLDDPGPPAPDRPVLWLNPAVPMTTGKAAAQVGHATMIAAALALATGEHGLLDDWAATGYDVSVRTPPQRLWATLHPGNDAAAAWRRRHVVAVRDAGYTEVPPGTITVLAQLP
jgi:peptidyl-tRNA hydrolase